MKLQDLVETLVNGYVQVETVNSTNSGRGNLPSDHPYVENGVDSNGNTLVNRPIVSGVSNTTLLAGVAAVLVIGGLTAAVVFD